MPTPAAFIQDAPRLEKNQFDDDRVLRSYLHRTLPDEVTKAVEPSLHLVGELAVKDWYPSQLQGRTDEPVHIPFDPWGNRIDEIRLTPHWHKMKAAAAEHGIVATAYENKHERYSRIHQFALLHLFAGASEIYSCPLAMTDGAAKTLLVHKNQKLIDRAVPHLTSRDPSKAWTSGQWMTERTGGSDVGLSEATAKALADGSYSLSGVKWFTSAATSEMALTLARPDGNGPGGKGLALFYVEIRNTDGSYNGITVHRLKDKLGTKQLPTAELTLDNTIAHAVTGLTDGVRNIAPMLNITRTWNAISSVGGMRRALALAYDYATRRTQFGATLDKKPLHVDTLADLEAEYEAAFQLAFLCAELLGLEENNKMTEADHRLLRLVTPLAKLTTGKQAVVVASEALECFGGAGYVEDTGLPALLRDAQVLPIWEGTTNVLSLEALRAISREQALEPYVERVKELRSTLKHPMLLRCADKAQSAIDHAIAWLMKERETPARVEAGARRFSLTLGRSLALMLLCRHAQWSLENENSNRSLHSAVRFASMGVDRIADDLSELLAMS